MSKSTIENKKTKAAAARERKAAEEMETIKAVILQFLKSYPKQYFTTSHLAGIAGVSDQKAKKALVELRSESKITGGATGYDKESKPSWMSF